MAASSRHLYGTGLLLMAAIRTALVVGGGIGGLTAGTALARRGIAVDLVEVRPDLSVYGVGIIQPNNTLRALAKIDLAQSCVDKGAPFPGWRLHDASGKLLMELPSPNDADPRFPPVNGITRPTLAEILIAAARREGVETRLNETVATLKDHRNQVEIGFTSGRTASYDLVVGSDGLYSDLRRRLFGDAHRPQFTGEGVWRYNLPRPADLTWAHIYFGPDSKAGLVPIAPNLMYMLLVTHEPGNPRFDREAMADEMRTRLSRYSGFVADLRAMIGDPAGVVYRPMETILLPSPWMKGRTILIGDAAHATTPHLAQGAAIAIEDAVLLGELMSRDEPVGALLEEFMSRRFERARYIIESSVQIGAWEMEEWAGVADRGADQGALTHVATQKMMEAY